jgi:ABC-2 type transport system ATP-binding protein
MRLPSGASAAQISSVIDDVIKAVGLEAPRRNAFRELSGGQQKRLSLGIELITKPNFLFLDEPTASLDPDIAHKIRALLKEERRSAGLSILYTSHNMREMEEMSDRIIFLQRGKIVAEGTAREIIARFGQADLEEVFLKLARER